MPKSEASQPPEVTCRELEKTFHSGGKAINAIAAIDLRFSAGETTALVGPSGCGKSTLLRLIAGLEEPSAGSVQIGGEAPVAVTRRAGLAFAFQDAALLPWLTVRQNVALALKLARRERDESRVSELIDLVGLNQFADTRPAELSGGMRQRAAMARCLVTEPGLLLLDEPFGAVDELTRARLNQELPALWQRRGTTTLLVTHSISEAVEVSDRVIVFSPRPARVIGDFKGPRGDDTARRALVATISDTLAAASAGLLTP
ncbi:ABC transporter ATP-binding protein [Devosia sp. SL43]|nr:ABC transporter ATP-binding protein [Devosia sp. SL43]UJW86214.1 ABC transporter ATP-binding protein [Devosia sp. SL43]